MIAIVVNFSTLIAKCVQKVQDSNTVCIHYKTAF